MTRCGAPGAAHRRAFTLVEMLVVLVVLGIMAALTAANLAPGQRGALQREATRLAGALEHASATAQWRSETLGVSAEGSLYRFWRRDGEGRWQVITSDEVLAPRALPDGMLARPQSYAGAAATAEAILPFRPSGRNDPYRIVLVAPGWYATIDADPLSRITWRLMPTDSAPS